MRVNTPITARERSFPAEQRLISATDEHGNPTYCNAEVTGRTSLLGRDLETTAHSLHALVERFNV